MKNASAGIIGAAALVVALAATQIPALSSGGGAGIDYTVSYHTEAESFNCRNAPIEKKYVTERGDADHVQPYFTHSLAVSFHEKSFRFLASHDTTEFMVFNEKKESNNVKYGLSMIDIGGYTSGSDYRFGIGFNWNFLYYRVDELRYTVPVMGGGATDIVQDEEFGRLNNVLYGAFELQLGGSGLLSFRLGPSFMWGYGMDLPYIIFDYFGWRVEFPDEYITMNAWGIHAGISASVGVTEWLTLFAYGQATGSDWGSINHHGTKMRYLDIDAAAGIRFNFSPRYALVVSYFYSQFYFDYENTNNPDRLKSISSNELGRPVTGDADLFTASTKVDNGARVAIAFRAFD